MKLAYEYLGRLVRIVDGDTAIFSVDLGFDTHRVETLRLLGIDSPEPHTETREAGDAATAHLEKLLDGCEQVLIRTQRDKSDKYGRYLATLVRSDGVNVNAQMVKDGHASCV